MPPSLRRACILLVLVLPLASEAFADSQQDAHELLSRSFQQADLWKQGPVKLVAKFPLYRSNGQVRMRQYTVFWAGPEKWRVEYSDLDLQQTAADGGNSTQKQRDFGQVTILNNGKLSYVSNQPKLLKPGIWFEAALAALDGGTPSGPYSLAPLDYENAKFHVSKQKINGADARCLAFGQPKTTFCIDPASGHLLTADNDLGSFEYSNYSAVGSNSYPQTVKVSSVWSGYEGDDYFYNHGVAYTSSLKPVSIKTPKGEAQLTVTRGEKFPDSLFVAPENNTTVDFASCADLATNFTPPRLVKSVKAKRPEAARKNYRYGWLWVLATVGKDGSVQKTAVLSGDSMLSAGAIDAVRGYKYTPYLRCGQAAEFQQVFVVAFPPPGPPVYATPSHF